MLLSLLLPCLAEEADAPSRAALAASGAHALALDAEGGVWAWGSNQRRESDPRAAEARVLLPVKIMDGGQAVACGRQFSMVLGIDGTLYMWGDNSQKQIPGCDDEICAAPLAVAEDVVFIAACESRAAMITRDGRASVWGDGLAPAPVADGAAQIALGLDFTLVLSSQGEVLSCAEETTTVLENCVSLAACGQGAYAIQSDGTLLAWGANGSEGRLGLDAGYWVDEPTPLSLRDIACFCPGVTVSAAIDLHGQLYIWGVLYSFVTHFDASGEAVGSLTDAELIHYGSTPIPLNTGVRTAAFGDAFAVLMLANGTICTWGSNDQGQIGDGTYTATAASEPEDDEDEPEIIIVSSEQRIFPVYLRLGA